MESATCERGFSIRTLTKNGLPDPVELETEEQRLEREQNGHDVLEALGD